MPNRIVQYVKAPWTGGINSSVDPGALSDNDLTTADNIIFTTSGSRKKREGVSYFDKDLPSIISRKSSGTTRSLVFNASLQTNAPTNQFFVVGEQIAVSGSSSGNQSKYLSSVASCKVTSITTTTLTNDTLNYTFSGATALSETNTLTSTLSIVRNAAYLDVRDYWRYDASFVKQQLLMAFSSQGKMFSYDVAGNRAEIIPDSTDFPSTPPFPDAITQVNSLIFNDRYIVFLDGAGNMPIYFRPETDATHFKLLPNAPNASMAQEHIGRIWTNDKSNNDRLNYSSPGNPEEWKGVGDSAAIDIVPGDGDPDGISAIYPSFKGTLFCAKGTHHYRIDGNSPETFFVNPVTKGLGCVSHKAAAALDMDDIVFVSKKGMHGLSATQNFGDFEQDFLSLKIHNNFNQQFNRGRLNYIQSAYIPTLNSVAFAVSEGTDLQNNDIWFFNTVVREWYRWPDISCTAIGTRLDSKSLAKLITGTKNSRIIQAQNGTHTDFGMTGISYHIRTGVIYPDGNPTTLKAFKYVGFIYRPIGHYRFVAQVVIDNQRYQNVAFQEEIRGDILGQTFILGVSVLGTSNQFSSFREPIDGIGHGLTIDISQSGTDETVELYGIIIGYEPAGDSQETL